MAILDPGGPHADAIGSPLRARSRWSGTMSPASAMPDLGIPEDEAHDITTYLLAEAH